MDMRVKVRIADRVFYSPADADVSHWSTMFVEVPNVSKAQIMADSLWTRPMTLVFRFVRDLRTDTTLYREYICTSHTEPSLLALNSITEHFVSEHWNTA